MVSELEKIIEKNEGNDATNVYNFISEEFRRFFNHNASGIHLVESEQGLEYKNLFYSCYTLIKDYLSSIKESPVFSWKSYNEALKICENGEYIKLKVQIKDELARKINSKIDEYREKNNNGNKYCAKKPDLAYEFSAMAFNVLTNLKFVSNPEKKPAIQFQYWI